MSTPARRRDILGYILIAAVVLLGCYIWLAGANVWPPLH